MSLFAELNRRNIARTAILDAIARSIVMQMAEVVITVADPAITLRNR